MIYEDDEYMPIPWGFKSELIRLKPNKYGYLLLCLNFKKGYLGKFQLEIFANKKDIKFKLGNKIFPDKEIYTNTGKWLIETAGGNIDN